MTKMLKQWSKKKSPNSVILKMMKSLKTIDRLVANCNGHACQSNRNMLTS